MCVCVYLHQDFISKDYSGRKKENSVFGMQGNGIGENVMLMSAYYMKKDSNVHVCV